MLSTALQILLTITSTDNATQRRKELLKILPDTIDWQTVQQLIVHHGLVPMVYTRLRESVWAELPSDWQASLELMHRKNINQSLALTGELVRLLKLLQVHNIFALPYKGPVLAAQLYGDVAMRQYGDLDVLVHLHDFPAVASLMSNNGWIKKYALREEQLKQYSKNYKDYAFYSQSKGALFEIHWQIGAKAYSFPQALPDIQARCQTTLLNNFPVATMSPEDLILILCFHGAIHLWERLSWLVDIERVLTNYPNLDWAWIKAEARRLKCQKILWFSLYLVQSLLKVSLPVTVQAEMRTQQQALRLGKTIEAKISQNPFWLPGLWERAFFHIKMQDDWRARFTYCFYTIFRISEEDWVALPALPPFLFFLYYPIRFWRVIRQNILAKNAPSA